MSDLPVPGVRSLDHTADLGLVVEAPDAAGLLARAAAGMDWLLHEAPPPRPVEVRTLEVEGADLASVLRAFLQELLLWSEIEGLSVGEPEIVEIEPTRCVARIPLAPSRSTPVREIKGVTWHGLEAERRNDRWCARVIFDV